MTQQQLIEEIQELFPNVGETRIRHLLNRALEDFCMETEILRSSATITGVADVRYYNLSDFSGISDGEDVLEIDKVEIDNKEIAHFIGDYAETEDLTYSS